MTRKILFLASCTFLAAPLIPSQIKSNAKAEEFESFHGGTPTEE
jgi:hypothetical protein